MPGHFFRLDFSSQKELLPNKMNNIKELDNHYFRADRTLECYLLTNSEGTQKIIYIYNREGLYFKVFLSIAGVIDYFINDKDDGIYTEYDDEDELDNFLETVDLKLINCTTTPSRHAGQ